MRARAGSPLVSALLIMLTSGQGVAVSLGPGVGDALEKSTKSRTPRVTARPDSQCPFTFRMPWRVGAATLDRQKMHDGVVTWTYSAPATTVLDVVAYQMSVPVSRGAVDLALRRETDARKKSLLTLVRLGLWTDYAVAFDTEQPVVTAHDTVPGRVVATAFASGGRRYVAFVYVYALKGTFVSVLITVPEHGWSANRTLAFPRLLMSELVRQRCA